MPFWTTVIDNHYLTNPESAIDFRKFNVRMNSRTNLRLQLMREQSLHDQHKLGFVEHYGGNVSPSIIGSISSSSPMMIKTATNSMTNTTGDSSGGSFDERVKTSPIIISQQIRFSGNRLMHLQPQIIHVQQQDQLQHISGEDMGRRNLTLSSSLPPGLPQNTPPKMPANMRTGTTDIGGTPHRNNVQKSQRAPSGSTSRHSPADMSPGGYADSPQSNSFTSAQSELDDVIIDEILSMEEEQRKRDGIGMPKMSNRLSYADNLESLLTSGRNIPFHRQVSNSAPTSTIDIEGLVREELMQEQEIMRDRRKKDIHNMIERRRRYNINDRIKELGTLLPKTCTEDLKLNKGTILKATVEYIRLLRRDQERTHQALQRYQTVEHENKQLAMRIQELEQRLRHGGIPVPASESSSTQLLMSDPNVIDRRPGAMDGNTSLIDRRSGLIDRPIKSEPLDDDQTPQPRPDHPAPSFHTPMISSVQQNSQVSSRQQFTPTMPTGQTPSAFPTQQLSQQHPHRYMEYNGSIVSGHNYSMSTEPHLANYYPPIASFGSSCGILETPPVVTNNLSIFGARRPPLGLINQQQQHTTLTPVLQRHAHLQQHHQPSSELIMDISNEHMNLFGDGVPGGTVGDLVSSSTAALMSSSDPLMSDSRLITQVTSPEVQWDPQTFSPEAATERMDYIAQ